MRPFRTTFTEVRGTDGRNKRQGATGLNRAVGLTNRYQGELLKVFDSWTRRLAKDISAMGDMATEQGIMGMVDDRLPELLNTLQAIGRQRLTAGMRMGLKRHRSDRADAILAERIASNDSYLSDSLIPALRDKIAEAVQQAGKVPVLQAKSGQAVRHYIAIETDVMVGMVASMRARVGSYSGALWEVIWTGVRIRGEDDDQERISLGKKTRRVRWVLDPTSDHCQARPGYYGCTDLAGEYESWDALPTVPGAKVACLTSCRCRLSIEEWPGVWISGL